MFQLEAAAAAGHVVRYARNERIEFNIPYDFEGVGRVYEPDFLVKLASGVTLIVEIKGQFHNETEMKHQAADQWMRAVTRCGQLGTRDLLVCRDLKKLGAMLAERLGKAAVQRDAACVRPPCATVCHFSATAENFPSTR